jgi:sugar transferase EpsL
VKRSLRTYDAIKRGVDIVVSALALLALAPVLALVAMLVRARLGSPAIFRQQRPGRGGRLFTLYKFRTMLPAPAGEGALGGVASDAERMTPFGSRLRATSLDELPTLLNVLRGDMSLVGPRPLLPEYLARYTSEQGRRHEVRPGVTGWAQVNGRNALPWTDRLSMDVWYVDHRSLALDMRILWMTVTTVAEREGVSAPGSATMEPFGSEHDDHTT